MPTSPDARPAALTTDSLLLAVRELTAGDRHLRGVVERFGPPPLWPRRQGFATLVRIILEQQVSLAAARTLYRRITARTGGVTPRRIIAIGVPGLRTLGLTGIKASYIVGLATEVVERRLPLRRLATMDEGTGRAHLLGVRGIGPWTTDVYYLFALRHPDVWPRGDLALAQAMHEVKQLPARPGSHDQERVARRWAPYRSVAARILWHHYLSTR